ncbi:MAG: metallophosphoesterase [Chloroflexota bacterium]|nr:metallophosphoesterase [Chloroflexota bacterium]
MRIVITSDTHYTAAWHDILARHIAEIAQLQPDCVVVAGDVGEGVNGFDLLLKLLETLPCPRLILAGNHDLWINRADKSTTSDQLWAEVLPRLTRERGAIWLEDTAWVQDGIAVCGTLGWYDYSARDPAIAMTPDDYARRKMEFIADAYLMRWERSDIDFANEIGAALERRLAALNADVNVRQIVVATHVPAFEEGIARKPGNVGWNTSNAYFGNLTLGARIAACPKVTHVISGHTHVGKRATVQGASGAIHMEVIPADYGRPAYTIIDI